MREGDSIDFGAEIGRIVRRMESTNPDIPISVRTRKAWDAVADARVLKHTDAVFVVPGSMGEEVIIYVDSQIWATDLNLQAELFRLHLNIKIQEMLEESGRAPSVHDDSALFEQGQLEHVKRLKFVPSKEKYTKHYGQEKEEDLESICRETAEPVKLDDEELASLYVQVSHIQDEELRKLAFDTARANMEMAKGREAAESNQQRRSEHGF